MSQETRKLVVKQLIHNLQGRGIRAGRLHPALSVHRSPLGLPMSPVSVDHVIARNVPQPEVKGHRGRAKILR